MKNASVLIVQRILPPYRLPFFTRLSTSSGMSVTLAYGEASIDSALESIPSPSSLNVIPLKNVYFGKGEKVIYQKGISQLIDSRKYDTIIAEFNPRIVTNVWAFIKAKRPGMRFIWWGHGIRPSSTEWDKKVYLWLAQRADALIFYNADGADRLISMGIPAEQTFIAWNTIDTTEISHLADGTPVRERTRILCIGRLIREKKVDLLIRAFAVAKPSLSPNITLTIIGDGPERSSLERLAKQLNVGPQVEFLGSIYNQDKLAVFFNTAWMSISTGYVGLSAIHSLAYGVPMLIADKEPHSPEISAIEEGVNALFFRSDDAEDLADHITHLFEDPDRLEQMSQAARKTVKERFNISVMVKAFEEAVKYVHQIKSDK